MKITTFLSYSRADGAAAESIADRLAARGIGCWVDRSGIETGDQFDRAIERAIRRSDATLWLVSAASVASDYVRFEVTTALHHGKPVLPVRLEPIDLAHLPAPLNFKLGNVQSWDHFAAPADDPHAGLAEGLRGMVRRARRRSLTRTGGSSVALGLIGGVGLWLALAPVRPGDPKMPAPRPIPARVAALPSAEVLRVIYTESPPNPATAYPPLALRLDIEARRRGETRFTPLPPGGVLASGDGYRIVAMPRSAVSLYVFQVDASGRVDWLFPANARTAIARGTNPVAAGREVRIPADGSHLFLDQTVGFEHLYVVASATRWPRLEEALARPLPAVPETLVEAPFAIGLRGVGGVEADAPGAGTSAALGDRYRADGPFLVLERGFRHVAR